MPGTPPPTDDGEPTPEVDLSAAPGPFGSFEALIAGDLDDHPALAIGETLGDRYVIDRMIGAGGMGTVYLATDRSLERPVAIKLHQARTGTERLQREAVAMARLAHPNVVAVYEVGVRADQPFVAMEYVAGTTLRGWMAAVHSPRERIALLIGAGTGLAAAHDAGLVHRDFKPENVLIGVDQRARVGDFGLARGSLNGSVTPITQSGGATKMTALTQVGTVIGTPAYMAPEQMIGAEVDARADQFAFCVVAWEVLVGERPFVGPDLDALASAVEAGPRKPSGLRASVRQVLERGLAFQPARRYPDMPALLTALRRASRARWPWLAVPAVALIASGLVVAWPRAAVVPSCDDAGDEVASLPRDLPARVTALGTPYARAAAPLIARELDAYDAAYRTDAQTACRAGLVDRAWSAELYEKSRVCLSIGLQEAILLVGSAEVAPTSVTSLAELVASLPLTTNCTNPATLAALPLVPVEHRDQLIAARALTDAAILENGMLGTRRAREAIEKLSGPIAAEPSIAVRLAMLRGLVLQSGDHFVEAERQIAEAYFAARGTDDAELMLLTLVGLIDLAGDTREDAADVEGWIKNALADVARVGARNPRAASEVYNAVANVRFQQGDLSRALPLSKQAVDLHGNDRDRRTGYVLSTHSAILCAMAHYQECFAAEERALAILREKLGSGHPDVAFALASFALDRNDARRPADALAFANEAREILAPFAGMFTLEVARANVAIASTLIDTRDDADHGEAERLLSHAHDTFVRLFGPDHPEVATTETDLGLLDLDDHHPDLAISKFERATASLERSVGPDSLHIADAQYNLAAALLTQKRYPEAFTAASRVVAIRTKRAPGTLPLATALVMAANIANLESRPAEARELTQRALAIPVLAEPGQVRAWAKLEEGRARISLGSELDAARLELNEALALYSMLEMGARAKECEGLLARLGHGR